MPNFEDIFDIVRRDLEAGFEEVLPARGVDAFRVHRGFGDVRLRPITNFVDGQDAEVNSTHVVPWEYTGTNVGGLLGIPPQPGQPKELTIEGVTLLETDPDDNVVSVNRFVNWAKTLEELHVRVYTRPVVDVRTRFPEAFMAVPELRRLVENGTVEAPPGRGAES